MADARGCQATADRAIFIGGVARSGTTLMRRLLDRHRDIAAFGETKLSNWQVFRKFPIWFRRCPPRYRQRQLEVFQCLCLTRFYHFRAGWRTPRPLRATWRLLDRLWLSRFYRFQSAWNNLAFLAALEELWLSDAVQSRAFALNLPEKTKAQRRLGMRGLYRWFSRTDIERCFDRLQALMDVQTTDQACLVYGAFWASLFSTYAHRQGKKYWAEKTPGNVRRARFLARCFEHVKIINMVRDGRDVACSAMRVPWGAGNPTERIDRWGRMLTLTLRQLEELPDDRYLNVRYEDLVLSPEPTLRRITEFLQVDWDENMLTLPIYATSVGQYRSGLHLQVQQRALDKWGELLADWGYLEGK